jgi:hypothetical protein
LKIRNTFPEISEEKNNFLLADGWTLLREPEKIILTMIFSVPLMFFLGLISGLMIYLFSPTGFSDLGMGPGGFSMTFNVPDIIFAIVVLYALIYLHEIFHLIFIPGFLHSDTTSLGLSWFGGYTCTEEVITKAQYVVIGAMPFLVISVLTVIILGPAGHLSPLLKVVCFLNALGSSVDFFSILLVLLQVPNGSKLVMNGRLTYYKVR